jgi:hypothetical protein
MPLPIVNFLLFQVGWFACVLGGAYSWPWLGTFVAIFIVGFHVFYSTYPGREIWLILFAVVIGAAWDSLLVWLQWITYASGMWSTNLAPHWIIALWALFATTLNVSLRWMKRRLVIAVLSGAIAGPLAYYAGFRLGAVNFTDTSRALVALSIGWAVLMPAMLIVANRLDGYASKTEQGVVTT